MTVEVVRARSRSVARVVGVALAVLAGSLAGCAIQPAEPPWANASEAPPRSVEIEDRELVLHVGDTRRTLTTVDDIDGIPVHATLRPGGHDEDTVVMLTRVDDEQSERYELRYLVATEDTVSELYWFPWRLQVAEELPDILDVAPLPVWAPDGSAIAWVEWVEAGTRLRTVGWIDEGETRNPSDDSSAYVLRDVPAGVQLETWQVDGGGDPVLIGRQDDQPYRIQLALGSPGAKPGIVAAP